MSTQTYNAVVKLGGAVDNSFKGIGGAISKSLGQTQKDIRKTKSAQTKLLKEIEKNRKAGNDVSALEREYESLGHELDTLTHKQNAWNKAQKVGSASGKMFGQIRTGMIGAAAGATVLGGAFAGLTMANKEFAAEASQAAAVGLDYSTYKAFGAVVNEAGLEAESVIDLVEELNNKMGESAGIEEITAVTEGLDILGLAYEDIAQLKPEDQFIAIAKAAQELDDAQQAASAMDMLMGGEANKIIGHLRQQGIGIDELVDSYKGLNLVTKEGEEGAKAFNKSMGKIKFVLGSAFDQLGGVIGGALAPFMEEWPEKISNFFQNNKEQINQWAGEAVKVIPGVLEGIKGVGKAIWTLGSAVNNVVQFFGGWENAALVVGAVMAGKFVASVIGVVTAVGGLVSSLGALGGILPVVGAGIKILGAAMLANPIGLIVGAIALAGAAIYANWGKVTEVFNEVWPSITNGAQVAWGILKKLFSFSPIGLVMQAWQPALDWIGSKFDWISGAAGKVKSFFGFGGDDEQSPSIGSALNANNQSPESLQAQQAISQTASARATSQTDARKVDNINIYGAPGQDTKDIGRQTAIEWGGDDALYDFAGA